jgi:Ca2+-binding RTX toxin-like protein
MSTTPPTLTQYLEAAEATYYQGTIPPSGLTPLLNSSGQPVISSSGQLGDGFYAEAFVNSSNQIIVAFEGTVPGTTSYDEGTLAADALISVGQIPQALKDAAAFINTFVIPAAASHGISTSNIFVTGHSLGGAEAEYAAGTISGLGGGDTFAAPGINIATLNTNANLTDYVDYGDVVGNLGTDTLAGSIYTPPGVQHVGAVKMVGSPLSSAAVLAEAVVYRDFIASGSNPSLFSALPSLLTSTATVLGDLAAIGINQGPSHSLVSQYAPDLNYSLTIGTSVLAVSNGSSLPSVPATYGPEEITNDVPYASSSEVVSSGGQLQQVTVNDTDGTSNVVNLDTTGGSWLESVNAYNSSHQLTANILVNNDNSEVDTIYNLTGGPLSSEVFNYSSSGQLSSIVADFTSGHSITFDQGTYSSNGSGLSFNSSTNVLTDDLATSDGTPVGTLALNASTNAGTVTLPDGTIITLSSIPANPVITDPTETPEQVLLSYLSDLGDTTTASALDTANYTYQNPTGTPYTLGATYDPTDNLYFFSSVDGAPGAQITGVTGYQNLLIATGDLTQDNIGSIQTLEIDGDVGGVTLTGTQFNAFGTNITGFGSIVVASSGSYSLVGVSASIDNFQAADWGGTMLTGNGQDGQTLTASLFGNDTLNAGNGAGDVLVAGEGVDTLNGGTGGDWFIADNGLAAGSSIIGSGTDNGLEVSGDISQATITDVQTLSGEAGFISLTASQLAGFTSVSGYLEATTAGTYSLAGTFCSDLSAEGTAANVTLIGNGLADVILQGGSGTDTLEAGSGADTELIAGSGTTSLYDGTGIDYLYGGTGNDTFYIANATAGTTVVGGTGSNTLVADTSGIGGISVSGFQTLDLGYYLSLNASQFTGFSTIDAVDGATDISANTGGTYNLSAESVTGSVNLTGAYASGGVTLIGNNQASQTLTGGSNTDTLEAGNGASDILVAGAGTETLIGGSGSDVFDLGTGVDTVTGGSGYNWLEAYYVNLAAGDVLNGGSSGGNTLQVVGANINISGATLSNIQGLNVDGDVTMTASQLSEFSYISTYVSGATIYAASAGSYDLAALSVTGTFSLVASLMGNDTLIANNAGESLTDGDGVDTLEGGTGNDTFIINYGVSGTSISGGGGSDTIDAVYGDLSQLTISGVQTIETALPTETITLTASQFSSISDFVNSGSGTATLDVIGTGTYSLTGKTVTGSFSVQTVSSDDGATLNLNDATTSLTSSAFNGYGTLDNTSSTASTIDAANVGVYDLATKTVTGKFNLDASGTSANVVLIGNSQAGQSLTAGSGTDFLTAGNGGADLYDGSGVDTLTGGTGNDTFYINNATSGTTVVGGGGSDALVVSTGGIAALSISGIQTVDLGYYLDLSASQFSEFSNIDALSGAANMAMDTSGTYDLSGKSVTGSINLNAIYTSGSVTLVGNGQAYQTLTGGSYTDTLEAGNGSGDVLDAGSGNTTLIAGTGSDTLTGGGGTNTYEFGSSFGTDTINDAGAGGAATGTIAFTSSGTTDEKLWFQQSGNNLLIDLLGTTDQITVSNFYSSTGNQVASFTADGLTLDSQLASLVSAMATYSAAHSGFNPQTSGTTMPTDTTLQNAIAASWHS